MTSRRLARIVRVKKLVEQTRSTELAESQTILDRAADDLRQTHEELQALNEAQTENTPTADQLQAAAAYQGHLERHAVEVLDQVVVAKQQVEEDREKVAEIWRERRLLEDFQDRLVERERLEAESEARRVADDMALNAHIRAGLPQGEK